MSDRTVVSPSVCALKSYYTTRSSWVYYLVIRVYPLVTVANSRANPPPSSEQFLSIHLLGDRSRMLNTEWGSWGLARRRGTMPDRTAVSPSVCAVKSYYAPLLSSDTF